MDYNNAYNKPYCGISQPVPGPSTGFFPPNATTPTFLKVPNPPYIKQEVGTVGDGAMHGGTVTPPVNYSQNQNYGVELAETPDPDKPLFYRNVSYMANPYMQPHSQQFSQHHAQVAPQVNHHHHLPHLQHQQQQLHLQQQQQQHHNHYPPPLTSSTVPSHIHSPQLHGPPLQQIPQHHLQRLPNPPSFHEYPEHSNASNIDSPLEPPAYIILQTPLTSSTPSSMPISISVAPIAPPPSLALSCTYCPKSFETQVKLDKHAETHQTPVSVSVAPLAPTAPPSHTFSCDICSKNFETKVKLDKHVRTHQAPTGSSVAQQDFKCRMCDKTFRTKSTLICHEKVHGENGLDNTFSCVECGKVFASADKLHVHRRLHTGEKPYQCKVCLKRFNHQSNLIVHSRIHQKVKQALKCARCNKVLDSEERLAIHMRLHTGEKPYKCSYCDKRFNHKSTVSTHEKAAHIAANSFKCDRCHKTFNQKCQLQYHEKLQEEHTIACTLCDKLFCYKASHKEHMFKVHFPRQKKGGGSAGEASTGRTASDGQGRNKFKCTICERRFYYKRALEMHMGVHDATLDVNVLYFSCNFCPETFTEETELEQHEAKHVADGTTDFLQNMQALDPPATDGFRCPLCFKRFDDQRTLREHHKTHLCADPCCAKCAPAQRDEFDLTRSTYDAGEDTRPTACNICHRVLPSFEQFQNHFHYHTTRVPFYCYHCREEFNGKRELYAHSRTHTQREPESYTCEVCAKVFSTKGNYKRHLKSHETVRAFACDRCSKQYDYKSALEAHLKRAHGIEL